MLRPGGLLGLIWNIRDQTVPWVAELTRVIGSSEMLVPGWDDPLHRIGFRAAGQGGVQADHGRSTPSSCRSSPRSRSYVATLPAARAAACSSAVDLLTREHPDLAGGVVRPALSSSPHTGRESRSRRDRTPVRLGAMVEVLVATGLVKDVPPRAGSRRHRPHGAGRRAGRAAGTQRRGQDHDAADVLGAITPDEGWVEIVGHRLPRGRSAAMARRRLRRRLPAAGRAPARPRVPPHVRPALRHRRAPAADRRARSTASASGTSASAMGTELSSGQQTLVGIVKATLHRPRLLVLDEPTASLDPDVAQRVRTRPARAVRRGRHLAAGHQPQHGRGRAPLRAGGVHVGRAHRRRRHARRGRRPLRPRRPRGGLPPPRRRGPRREPATRRPIGHDGPQEPLLAAHQGGRAPARVRAAAQPHRLFDVTIWPLVDVLLFGSIGVFVSSQTRRAARSRPATCSRGSCCGTSSTSRRSRSPPASSRRPGRATCSTSWSRRCARSSTSRASRSSAWSSWPWASAWSRSPRSRSTRSTSPTSAGASSPSPSILLVVGWAIALFVIGLVLRFGTGAEALAWGILFVVMPLSGVFYPVRVAPLAAPADRRRCCRRPTPSPPAGR